MSINSRSIYNIDISIAWLCVILSGSQYWHLLIISGQAGQARQAYIWARCQVMSCSFPRCRCGTEGLSDFNWSLSRWHDTAQLQYPQSLSGSSNTVTLSTTLNTEEHWRTHKTSEHLTTWHVTAAVTLGLVAVTTLLWYHVMTRLNTDHLLSRQSAEQTLEIGIKNNLEIYNIYGWNRWSRNSCNCDLPFSRVEGSADLVA